MSGAYFSFGDLRTAALDRSISTMPEVATTEAILERAEKFFYFLIEEL